jgi:iron complex outermembrane receptor protein
MYGQDLFGVDQNNHVQYICLTQIINQLASSGSCRTASFTDVNLTGTWQITSGLQISAAVENAFDKLPPVNLPNYAGVNYNPTYSQAGIVGRFFRLGFRFSM